MPDGNIQLTVTLTPQEVKAKSIQLRNEIQKIFESTNTGGLTKSMEKLLSTMDTLNNKAEMIQEMMHKMETTKVVNPHLKELREEVKQASKDIEHFSMLRKKMLDEGVDKDGEEYNKVTEAMFNSIHKAADATTEIGKLYDLGQDKITEAQADPETYNALKVAMGEVNNERAVTISQFNAEKQAAEGAGDSVAKAGEATAQATPKVSVFNRALSAVRNGLGGVHEYISKVTFAIRRKLSTALSSVQTALQKAFSFKGLAMGLKRLAQYTFGAYSLVSVFNKLKSAAKEGMGNLARYNDKISKGVKSHNLFNDAMTNLNTSLLYLKNAWAAAFAPLVIKVMPILVEFITFLGDVGNAIAQLIAQLTGQETAYNAVKAQAQDYADSLDKATKSSKKLQRQLASYDKLDVIKHDSDGDSDGNGSYKPDVQQMFTTVKPVSSLAKAIQDAFDTDDWRGLGDRVATNVANAFDRIPWPAIQAKVQKGAEGTANFINGFLGNAHLWTSSGTAAAQALNTVSLGIKTFNDTIDPVLIGYNASLGFRTFLLETNWGQLGSAIGGFFTNINKGLTTFLHNMPTQEVVDSIMEFINGLNLPQVVQTTLTLALTGIVTLVKLGGQFIGTAGYDLGLKLVAAVSEVHMDKYTLYDDDGNPVDTIELPIKPTVDWTEHPVLALLFAGSDYHAKILVDVMTGGSYNELQNLWDSWPEWLTFEGLGENVVTSFKALFEFDWLFGDGSAESGFLGARGIVTWFKEDVIGIEDLAAWWNSCFLSEWFGEMDKETGKIKKKSTPGGFMDMLMKGNSSTGAAGGGGLMSAQMKSLIPSNDLLTKIQSGWSKIKGFINDPLGTIRTKVDEIKKHINEKFNFENVKTSVKEKWDKIKGNFVGEDSVLYKIRTKITETKKHINEKFNFENVRKAVKEKWDKIKGYFVGDESILTKIKKRFEDIKFKNPFEIITDAVNAAKKAITGYDKQAAKTGWASTTKIHVKGLAEQLEDAFEGIVKALPTPIKGALKKIQDFINGIIKGVNDLTSKLNGIKISGVNPFTGKAYSYGFNIPKIDEIKIPGLAQGAVIPPNKEFLALLGDQKQGVNIETPLDTMVAAFERALDSRGGSTNHEPIVLQLDGRVVAKTVWDEEAKKYKQTGFGLSY